MNDRHLNMFHSYNLDNELIEDNLTRAFIVTLSFLSPKLLTQYLFRLLNKYSTTIKIIDFSKVGFALQANIDINNEQLRKVTHRFILTITGDGVIHGMDGDDDHKIFDKIRGSKLISPDAWIYDLTSLPPEYCFLIESKLIYNNLSAEQVIGYSKEFYGTNSIEEFKQSLINITWYDVLEVCTYFCEKMDDGIINSQELSILKHLKEFLGFYKFLPYKGWNKNELPALPDYNFLEVLDFKIEEIPNLPEYNFPSTIDFGLKRIPSLPSYIFKDYQY